MGWEGEGLKEKKNIYRLDTAKLIYPQKVTIFKEYLFQEFCQRVGCFSIPHIFQILEFEAFSHKNKALQHSVKSRKTLHKM